MIELHITCTSKGYAPSERWTQFDRQRKAFADMKAAMAWIKENYGNAKRRAMYRDRDNAKPMKCGYVIGFRNADWSHVPVSKWLQQDWIEFRECKTLNLERVA